jgi:hypothetical protein
VVGSTEERERGVVLVVVWMRSVGVIMMVFFWAATQCANNSTVAVDRPLFAVVCAWVAVGGRCWQGRERERERERER